MSEAKVLAQARIGKIAYTNTLPFYHGLTEGDETSAIREGYPAQINQWIQNGEIDIAPISSLEYGLHPEKYYLLPNLSIASRHYSGSVLLFSKFGMAKLNRKKISLSQESLSSQALLKILLSKLYHFENSFVVGSSAPQQMLADSDACLAIGDSALFYEAKEFVFKYDLGYLWHEWTQKPFCFSVWAVRKNFYEQNQEEVYAFSEKLRQTTTNNLQDLKTLISTGLNFPPHSHKFTTVFSYLSQLIYDLNEPVKDGLCHFYALAAEAGFIREVPELKFIPEKL